MTYNPVMKTNLIVKGLLLIVSCLVGQAQQPAVKKVAAKPTVSTSGKDLFRQYCAVCHGTDGKGAGPAAAAMKSSPTDLTQLARKNQNHFPEDRVLQILRGEGTVTAHGSQDMPVWGTVLNNGTNNLEMAQTRLHALLQFVADLQAK